MLVMTRKQSEGFTVNGPCKITVLAIEEGRVRIGCDAPRSTLILRNELVDALDVSAAEQVPQPPSNEVFRAAETRRR